MRSSPKMSQASTRDREAILAFKLLPNVVSVHRAPSVRLEIAALSVADATNLTGRMGEADRAVD